MNYYRITFKVGQVFDLMVKTPMTATELHNYIKQRSKEQAVLTEMIFTLGKEGMYEARKRLIEIHDSYKITDVNGHAAFPNAIIDGLIGINPVVPDNIIDLTESEGHLTKNKAELYQLSFTGLDGKFNDLVIKSHRSFDEIRQYIRNMNRAHSDMLQCIDILKGYATGVDCIRKGISELKIGRHHIGEITRFAWMVTDYNEGDFVLIARGEEKEDDLPCENGDLSGFVWGVYE